MLYYYHFQAGQEKAKKPILQWTREIVNHFWFCSSVANTEEEFIVSLISKLDFKSSGIGSISVKHFKLFLSYFSGHLVWSHAPCGK